MEAIWNDYLLLLTDFSVIVWVAFMKKRRNWHLDSMRGHRRIAAQSLMYALVNSILWNFQLSSVSWVEPPRCPLLVQNRVTCLHMRKSWDIITCQQTRFNLTSVEIWGKKVCAMERNRKTLQLLQVITSWYKIKSSNQGNSICVSNI